MPVDIVVPELGESVLEATVGRWLKQEGERVEVGEPVVELETDKVNVEVSARQSGVLSRIQAKDQQDVKVGDVLGTIDEAPSESQPAAPPPPREKVDTKPAAQPEPSGGEAQAERVESAQENAPPSAQEGTTVPAELTPVARRFAEEQGIDLSRVSGSGPGGRVTKADLEAYQAKRQAGQVESEHGAAPQPPKTPQVQPQPPAPPPAQRAAPAPQLAPLDGRGEERVKMSRRRRTIAQRLVEVQQTAAMLTTFNEIDMTAVMEMRKRRGEDFAKRYEVKLGFMSFFLKAVIGALREFPRLNAEIQGDEMVLKRYYDIGIAIGAEEGLVVPVLRDADRMTFAQIEKAIEDLARKTRENTLTLEDLRGGTFTITNGGVFGSLLSTPILTPPQVGILGMHKIEKRPIAVDDEVVIRPMMYVALSYDHRIVDGREAVQYLVKVKELVENPETLLLEG